MAKSTDALLSEARKEMHEALDRIKADLAADHRQASLNMLEDLRQKADEMISESEERLRAEIERIKGRGLPERLQDRMIQSAIQSHQMVTTAARKMIDQFSLFIDEG